MMLAKIRNSFLAILAGWATGVTLIALPIIINSIPEFFSSGQLSWENSGAPWIPIFGIAMGAVLLIVWFFLLLPLTLFVPDRSFLWKPRILGLIGIFVGPVICGAYQITNFIYAKAHTDLRVYVSPFQYILIMFYPYGYLSIVIGFVTCLVSAKLHQRLIHRTGRLDIPTLPG